MRTMNPRRFVMRSIVSGLSVLALGSSLVLGAATPASAAKGDAASFTLTYDGQPSRTVNVASGPNFVWTLDLQNLRVLRVNFDGTIAGATQLPLGNYQGLCTNGAGELYVIDSGLPRIVRLSVTGETTTITPPDGMRIFSQLNCAVDPSGNVWMIGPDANNSTSISRMTPEGNFSSYLVSNQAPDIAAITNGPAGSERMYFIYTTVVGQNLETQMGFVTAEGQISTVPVTGELAAMKITSVGQRVWAVARNENDPSKSVLLRLVDDATVQKIPVEIETIAFGGMVQGPGNTFWVTDSRRDQLVEFNADGGRIGAYPAAGLPEEPFGLTLANDGNLWTSLDLDLARVSTGAVPESSAAPAITPGSGILVGVAATVGNGTWRYQPSTYAYQWQLCASDQASSCTDIAGATAATYTPVQTDEAKYLRAGVVASNTNGPSTIAYSGLVGVGAATPPPPVPNPSPNPASGTMASIGNGVTMELDAPTRQKRGKSAWFEAVFSAADPQGTVSFTFRKGSKQVTKSVTVQDGIAEYRWKAPKKWRKGRTTVTATYVPSAGSPYQSASTLARVRIR